MAEFVFATTIPLKLVFFYNKIKQKSKFALNIIIKKKNAKSPVVSLLEVQLCSWTVKTKAI